MILNYYNWLSEIIGIEISNRIKIFKKYYIQENNDSNDKFTSID